MEMYIRDNVLDIERYIILKLISIGSISYQHFTQRLFHNRQNDINIQIQLNELSILYIYN